MDAPFFQEFEHDSKSALTHADHETTTDAGEHADERGAPRRDPDRPIEAKRAVDARRASSLRRLMTARDYLRAHFFEDLYLDDLAGEGGFHQRILVAGVCTRAGAHGVIAVGHAA